MRTILIPIIAALTLGACATTTAEPVDPQLQEDCAIVIGNGYEMFVDIAIEVGYTWYEAMQLWQETEEVCR